MNDVANAFAISVGGGSLTWRWVWVVAAVFEFSIAMLMGAPVTDTVRCVRRLSTPIFSMPYAALVAEMDSRF